MSVYRGWIDCDSKLDVGALAEIDEEIRHVLALLRQQHEVNEGLDDGVINRFYPSLEELRLNQGGPHLSQVKTITLKKPATYLTNHLHGPSTLSKVAELFPKLMAWIEQLPFTQYGRVFIIFDDEQSDEPIHKGPVPYQEFFWLRTNPEKRFFMYDETEQQEHDITSAVAWFDQARYHGAATPPKGSLQWSLRVDGVFTPDFRAWLHQQIPPLSHRQQELAKLFAKGEDLAPAMPDFVKRTQKLKAEGAL